MEKEINIFKIFEDLNNIKLYVFAISILVFLITYLYPINYFDQLKVTVNIEQKKNIDTFDNINNLSYKIFWHEMSLNRMDFINYTEYQGFKETDTRVFTSEILYQTYDFVLNKSLISNFYNKDEASLSEITEMNSFINKFNFKLEDDDHSITVKFPSLRSQVENDINFLSNVVSISNENIKRELDNVITKFLYNSRLNLKIRLDNYKTASVVMRKEREEYIEKLKTEYEIAKSLNLSGPADLVIESDTSVRTNIMLNKDLMEKNFSYFDGHIALGILIESEEKILDSDNPLDAFLNSSEYIENNLSEIEKIYEEESGKLENIFYLDKLSVNFEENRTRLIFSILFSIASILVVVFYITIKNAYESYKTRS